MHLPLDLEAPAWENAALVAPLLHEAGRSLRGRNLGLGAWKEVAQWVAKLRKSRPDAARQLLRALAGATCRADATRVLLRIRQHRRPPKGRRGPRSGRRPALEFESGEAGQEHAPAESFDDHSWVALGRLEPALLAPARRTGRTSPVSRLGLKPWTPVGSLVGEAMQRFAAYQPGEPLHGRNAIGQRLLEAARARPTDSASLGIWLAATLGLDDPEPLLRELGLDAGGAWAPLEHPGALALVHLLQRRFGVPLPCTADWASQAARIQEFLRRPPGANAAFIVSAFHAFHALAPAGAGKALVRALPKAAAQWLPLALLALPEAVAAGTRRAKGAPAQEPSPLLQFVQDRPELVEWLRTIDRQERQAHQLRLVAFDDIEAAASHSRLVAQNIWAAAAGVHDAAAPMLHDTRWRFASYFLASGGGSLADPAVPAFRVTTGGGLPGVIDPDLVESLLHVGHAIWAEYLQVRLGVPSLVRTLLAQTSRHGQIVAPATAVSLEVALEEHALCYAYLRLAVGADPARPRLARRVVRKVDERDVRMARSACTPALRAEGIVHALLTGLHDQWPGLPPGPATKEALIHAIRRVALVYPLLANDTLRIGMEVVLPPAPGGDKPLSRKILAGLAGHIATVTYQGALELQCALGIPHAEGLPKLGGGQLSELERDARRLLRRLGLHPPGQSSDPGASFEVEPLPRAAALARGDLASDCSSRAVPLRALQPHHAYCSVRRPAAEPRGYLSLVEAWACTRQGQPRRPVLCLDSINVPDERLIGAELDIVAIVQAIAYRKGVDFALCLGGNTWNFGNFHRLKLTRAWREGTPVLLAPADPVAWWLYDTVTREAGSYTAIQGDRRARCSSANDLEARLLPPISADIDGLRAATVAEIERILRGARQAPRATAHSRHGAVAGFTTGWSGVPSS